MEGREKEGREKWKEGMDGRKEVRKGKGGVENRRKVKGRGCKCAGCPCGPGAVGHTLCDPSWLLYGLVLPALSSCSSPYC